MDHVTQPRPTSSRMQGADRKHQLLETALEVFSRQGFEGATTKEIAARAGVTEAVIFRHFPSKHALYEAVLQFRHEASCPEDWLAETRACMERNDDAGLLRALAKKIVESYRNDARGQRILMFAALEGHQQGLDYNRQLAIPIFELLREYLVRRQKEGALRDYDAGLIIAAMAGMAQYFAMMTQMFGFCCDVPDDQVIETFTKIMMNGIQVPSESR